MLLRLKIVFWGFSTPTFPYWDLFVLLLRYSSSSPFFFIVEQLCDIFTGFCVRKLFEIHKSFMHIHHVFEAYEPFKRISQWWMADAVSEIIMMFPYLFRHSRFFSLCWCYFQLEISVGMRFFFRSFLGFCQLVLFWVFHYMVSRKKREAGTRTKFALYVCVLGFP